MLYYIKNYYTNEIIDITTDYNKAITICKNHIESIVTDENDNIYYYNIDIPF